MFENYKKINEECIICFEECNDQLYYFCKKCNYKFHKSCLKTWFKKCKENNNNCNKCLHCQEENCLYILKKCFCNYYTVKI